MLPKSVRKINLKFLFTVFSSLIIIVVAGIVALNSSYALSNSIYGGVKAMGLNLGGVTQSAAERLISSEVEKLKNHPVIHINFDEYSWVLTNEDLNWQIATEDLAQKAYMVGREGDFLDRFKERFYAYNNGKTVSFDVSYDRAKLKNFISEIAADLNRQPRNASLAMVNAAQNLEPEIIGIKVDEEQAFLIVDNAIKEQQHSINLPVEVTVPSVTRNDLEDITDVLSSYVTYIDPLEKDRYHNVMLAARYLDGALLRPDEIFSFNTGIGPRTIEMGYRDAPIFIGEDVVPGIGGGICQVSSTLYNAIILADLKLTERVNHSRPVPYTPLGRDATIAGDILDLKFKNNLPSNIYIRSSIKNNQVVVEILGQKAPEQFSIGIITDNVRVIKYKTIVMINNKLAPGARIVKREGVNGYLVTTYRMRYKDNKLISREKLYDDHYPAINEIIEIGAEIPPGEDV